MLLEVVLEVLLVELQQELEEMTIQKVRKRPHLTTAASETTSTIIIIAVRVVVHGVHAPPVAVTAVTRSTKEGSEERVVVLLF